MKHFILLCCLLFLAQESTAQNVTATTGGEGKAGGTTLAYTVGEVVVVTVHNGSTVLTQGFHQPQFVTTAIKETFLPGTVEVFPNPTDALVQVRFKEISPENIVVALHDAAGRTIATAKMGSHIWQADLSAVATGCYWLTVTDTKTKQSNLFKIIKINH